MATIFITGGSTGIGAACVRKFIGQGWNVGFMDNNDDLLTRSTKKNNNSFFYIYVIL
ncbi:MAG: SDR family NAD(P)-dependent oxidoreductase [Bacteroidales bacterium]|nr:SDR family NAD(P)-dependent oxidoreductase [Candidatus Cacconaster scatequi]